MEKESRASSSEINYQNLRQDTRALDFKGIEMPTLEIQPLKTEKNLDLYI
jgi:hypothetical protein